MAQSPPHAFPPQKPHSSTTTAPVAEVHLIGQLERSSGDGGWPDGGLSCAWMLHTGGGWRVVEGEAQGHTQTDVGRQLDGAHFSHPIDVHLATNTIQGWPKILLEVWHLDEFGRQAVCGYGIALVPTSPGEHEIRCNCWRPKGSFREELTRRFLGGSLRLRSLASLVDPAQRAQLQTVAMGGIHLRLAVITRHFDRFGILC